MLNMKLMNALSSKAFDAASSVMPQPVLVEISAPSCRDALGATQFYMQRRRRRRRSRAAVKETAVSTSWY